MKSKTSRREFLQYAAAGTAAAGLGRAEAAPAAQAGQTPAPIAANDRIQIALIGAGGQGMHDTSTALRVPGVELVAVADLYDGRLTRAKELWGNQIVTTRDHREILARPEIDAVIIATPDHWHGQIAVEALNAGKDVYVEKPMVQRIEDGYPLIEAQKKSGRIVEVGSQRVSSLLYAKAKALIASGAIGELNLVEASINRNTPMGAWQYTIPPDASLQTVDWDRFLGRAPKRPFDAVRFFRWRNYQDYGTGVAGDLFVHLLSGLHFVVSSTGPVRVQSTGGIRFWNDGRDVADVMLATYDYPKTAAHPAFNLFLKVNLADPGAGGENQGFRFAGTEGVLTIGNSVTTLTRSSRPKDPGLSIGTFPKAMQEQIAKEHRVKYAEERNLRSAAQETFDAPPGYSDSVDHLTNFINAVRTRKPVVEDAVFGLRAAGPALLANLSYFDKRAYSWNPETMKVDPPPTGSTSR